MVDDTVEWRVAQRWARLHLLGEITRVTRKYRFVVLLDFPLESRQGRRCDSDVKSWKPDFKMMKALLLHLDCRVDASLVSFCEPFVVASAENYE